MISVSLPQYIWITISFGNFLTLANSGYRFVMLHLKVQQKEQLMYNVQYRKKFKNIKLNK